MDERELAVVTQTTVTLPFLVDEVPALYLVDGTLSWPSPRSPKGTTR